MGTLDLRACRIMRDTLPVRTHYRLPISGRSIVYCYIRKNACTAFKTLCLGETGIPLRPGQSAIGFMAEHCTASTEDIAAAEYRICVLRDPRDRIASLFRNKFIQREGHEDVFASYLERTRRDPETASLRDVLTFYLSGASTELDPHFHRQRSHLLPVCYNASVMMDALEGMMRQVIGPDLANRYFSRPANASGGNLSYDTAAGDIPAETLRRRYLEDRAMPSTAALIDGNAAKLIDRYYRADRALLRRNVT